MSPQQNKGVTKQTKPSIGFRNTFLQTQLNAQPPEIHKEVQDYILEQHDVAIANYKQQMQDEGLLTADELRLDLFEQDSIIQARSRLRYVFSLLYLRRALLIFSVDASRTSRQLFHPLSKVCRPTLDL